MNLFIDSIVREHFGILKQLIGFRLLISVRLQCLAEGLSDFGRYLSAKILPRVS